MAKWHKEQIPPINLLGSYKVVSPYISNLAGLIVYFHVTAKPLMQAGNASLQGGSHQERARNCVKTKTEAPRHSARDCG